jgi:hypothetical protein
MLRCFLGCAVLLLAGPPPQGTSRKKPVPTYTNADLERYHALRSQTGVDSRPAVAPDTRAARPDPKDDMKAREAYWRREADRLRQRLRRDRDRAEDLRLAIDERWHEPGVHPVTDPRLAALRRELRRLEKRIEDAQSRFEERARRAGAFPGWLR